jgi:putative transposase
MENEMEVLENGVYYHIYNRGINGENLFLDAEHYQHFLNLYAKYIEPIADTFAWVLMPNHFHILVRIKENLVYKYHKNDKTISKEDFNELKWETRIIQDDDINQNLKTPIPHKHFSHLFNAYALYFNTRTHRHGGLFERRFKRKSVDNMTYLKRLVLYIHHNPVHHDFCEHPTEYPWSSFSTFISIKPTRLNRKTVIGWFDDEANFRLHHNEDIDFLRIEKWLDI